MAAFRICATVLRSEDEEAEGVLCVNSGAEGLGCVIVATSTYECVEVVLLCVIGEEEDGCGPERSGGAAARDEPAKPV